MDFKKDYFIKAAEDNNVSVKEYYESSNVNYVIIEGNSVIRWEDDSPVIFGDIGDAVAEIGNWCETFRNVSVIKERELIDGYCKKEMDKAIKLEELKYEDSDERMLTYFMNPYNAHNKELVLLINRLWKKNCGKFRPILVALYDRDLEEIKNADSFANLGKGGFEDEYTELFVNWREHAYNYLMHIADDSDLETIINFIRDDEYNLNSK